MINSSDSLRRVPFEPHAECWYESEETGNLYAINRSSSCDAFCGELCPRRVPVSYLNSLCYEVRDIYVCRKGQKFLAGFYIVGIVFFLLVLLLRHCNLNAFSLDSQTTWRYWMTPFNFVLFVLLFLEIITRNFFRNLPFDTPQILLLDSLLFCCSVYVLAMNRWFFLSSAALLDVCLLWNILRNAFRLVVVLHLLYCITDVKFSSIPRQMSTCQCPAEGFEGKRNSEDKCLADEFCDDYVALPPN